jgi:tetratricopeptide (TPR) repeat protein
MIPSKIPNDRKNMRQFTLLKRYPKAEETKNDVVRPFVGQKSRKLRVLLICAILILSTVAAFWQVHKHQFVSLDDFEYVVENNHVINGLSRSGFVWAFTTNTMGNWHPLTWLSLMLDCQLPGPKARTCHIVNLLFHIANALLLFYLLNRMTDRPWRSAFVAAIFALHPLHVESVAWVSERKDVLSTFFWLLTMWAYFRYAMRPNFARFAPVLLFFGLGLMAKPMLVTLPFVLLLMDYWPLRRWPLAPAHSASPNDRCIPTGNNTKLMLRLIAEKLPLFALVAISCVVAYLAQQSAGSIAPYSLVVRLANAALAYAKYIWLMFWPANLAPIYPYPQGVPIAVRIIAAVLLLVISSLVILLRRPYLTVGCLWYFGTLVPVIGIVQIGAQAMADRYTYVPLIGLFIAVTWAAAELLETIPFRKIILSLIAVAVLIAAGIATHFQVRHWRNSLCLFEHTLAVTKNNWLAHNGMGSALVEEGKRDQAIEHFKETLRIFPLFPVAMGNLVITLDANGQSDQAISNGRKFSLLVPSDFRIHKALADALVRRTQKRALDSFNASLAVQDMRDLDEAVKHYEKALRIKPDYSSARQALQATLAKRNKLRKSTKPNYKP